MNVRAAVARLEQRRDYPGQCPVCRDLGRCAVCIDDGVPIGCRVCGLLRTVKRIILADEPEQPP